MSDIIVLLKEKNKKLEQFLDFMQHKNFEGIEEEVEDINLYIKDKQVYIDSLLGLEKQIRACEDYNKADKDVSGLIDSNDALIKDIMAIDKNNLIVMNKLKEMLVSNLKKAKVSKQYNVKYNNYTIDTGGSKFDTKN